MPVTDQRFTTRPLYPRGGPQSQSGRCSEEKNPLSLPGSEPRFLSRPVRCLVAIPIYLSRLPNAKYGIHFIINGVFFICGKVTAATGRLGFQPRSGRVGFVVGKVALGQAFSEYFGFLCQFSFHRLLHTHHHLPSGAGTIGQTVADVSSGSVAL
jgi:hypothetical protein